MRAARWLLLWAIALALATMAGHIGLRRVEQAQALQCAKLSDGTDAEICACYHKYGLDTPEDLQ